MPVKRRPVTQRSKDEVFLVGDSSVPKAVGKRQFSLFTEATGKLGIVDRGGVT